MAKRGRPVAMDENDRACFLGLISLGHTLHDAARLMGVSPVTVRRLANLDPQFRENWKSSQRTCAVLPLKTIRDEAAKNWKAATWLIERVHNSRFGKRQPKHLYMEDHLALLNEFSQLVVELMPDHETAQRLKARLDKLCELHEEQWSPGRGWYAKAKREGRLKDAQASDTQPSADSTNDSESTPSASISPVAADAQEPSVAEPIVAEPTLPASAERAADSETSSQQEAPQ